MDEKKFLDAQGLRVIKDYIDIHSPLQSGAGENSVKNKIAETIGDNSIALGNNSITGYKGYHIRSIDTTNKKIYLSAVYPTTETIPTISEEDFTDTEFETPAYDINVEFSIILGQHYHFFGGKIVSVQNNVIIYSGDLPFDTIPSVALTRPWRYVFFVPSQPNIGELVFGSGGFTEGSVTYAEGNQAHAEGYGTIAAGNQSHAEGVDTKAGVQAHAEGESSIASGETSHAEGRNTVASGQFSHAQNYLTKATAESAHAEGYRTEATGSRSHAEGAGSKAAGLGSHAEGGDTQALGSYTHAEGYSTKVDENVTYGGHAEGHGTKVSAESGHAEGYYSSVTGNYGHAEGDHAKAQGAASHAEGEKTEATGVAAHSEGYMNIASGDHAHAEGGFSETITDASGTIKIQDYKNTASGLAAHAEGAGNNASGKASHAEGHQAGATAEYAHAEGYKTKATAEAAHAEGNYTQATGVNAHSEGRNTIAEGAYSHAEGSGSKALAGSTHAEGYNTEASVNSGAHAEGYSTKAQNQAAHAEGRETIASGYYTHAEGYKTQATNTGAHAEGYGTIADGQYQHVQGKFNARASSMVHIVGYGESDTDRKNIHTISKTGSAWFAGDVASGEGKLSTEKYVDDKVASIVESAPETLNTLNELAAALGDDPNFATTVSERIGIIEKEVEESSTKLNDIIEGNEIVPLALQAHEDVLGRDIVETYLEKATTITKNLNSVDFGYNIVTINEFLPAGTVLTFSNIDTSSAPGGYNWGFGFFENETQFDWIPFSEIVTYTMTKSVSNLTIRMMETDYGACWEESPYLVSYSVTSSVVSDINNINSTISNIVSGELPVAFAEQAYYSTTADYATNAGVADYAGEAGFAISAIDSYRAEQDDAGNFIIDTYATKAENNAVLALLKDKPSITVALNDIVPEGSMPSMCNFELKPTTPLCVYALSDSNVMPNKKFYGREIPFLTTKGNLKVVDNNNNIKSEKYIDSMINVNRNGWNVSDTLTQNGLHKVWSKKFYLTMDEYATRTDRDYGNGATNSLYTFEFDESDFNETGIPAKLDNIPVASPCFYTGSNVQNYTSDRVYGGQPFPLKFSYNQDTGKYTMTIRGLGAGLIFYQMTLYSKAYIYYQLETPYDENNFLALGLEEGDKITFENDYSEIQEYLNTTGFFKKDAAGDVKVDVKVETPDITPTVSTVIPQNTKEALNGFVNAAKIFNEGQSSEKDAVQDYSWIGDGDGSTDYTSILKKKIEELELISGGGTIFLGNGVYNISDFIELSDNIKIIGTGDTIIQQTDKNSHVFVISGSNIAIKDLRLKLYGMTAEEKEDVSNYNPELTACLYINSCNTPSYSNYNNKYSDNVYCKNLTVDNVYLSGCYGFKYPDGVHPEISNDYEYYRGCGIIQKYLYFNYATFTNVHISGMYHGLHGLGGSCDYTVFCESCKTMVYGGGGYVDLNIYGHSYYATDVNGNTISMSDEIGHFVETEQCNIAEYVYDIQWFKTVFTFEGLAMNNRYIVSQIAGASYSSNALQDSTIKLERYVIDNGRGNRGVENFQNTPFYIGAKYIDMASQTSFKNSDPLTQNVLSGAGIWGNITSSDSFNAGLLALSDICRYPTEKNIDVIHSSSFLSALSQNTPTEEQPIEIIIDISNRPIYSLPGCFIQFDPEYIASDFTIGFDIQNNDTFVRNITVKNNTDVVWYAMNAQAPFYKIYKIKIVITKALYIEKFKYQNSAYVKYEIEYNPDQKIGICNIGMIDSDFVGRTFLGECGGKVYGDLLFNNNSTIKNLPNPVDEGDAVNKLYVTEAITAAIGEALEDEY